MKFGLGAHLVNVLVLTALVTVAMLAIVLVMPRSRESYPGTKRIDRPSLSLEESRSRGIALGAWHVAQPHTDAGMSAVALLFRPVGWVEEAPPEEGLLHSARSALSVMFCLPLRDTANVAALRDPVFCWPARGVPVVAHVEPSPARLIARLPRIADTIYCRVVSPAAGGAAAIDTLMIVRVPEPARAP